MQLSWLHKKQTSAYEYFHSKKHPIIWTQVIPLKNEPIQYLEIGVLHGVNAVRIHQTYCSHRDSRIHCVDPWEDYEDYPEYKNQQKQNYSNFLWNIESTGTPDKFVIHQGYSENIVPTFDDNFFDLVFIDGNHETKHVYNDGVMSLSKTKPGGYIVFDDYNWEETKLGIDMFTNDYSDKIKVIKDSYFQFFIQKL